jgi:uncharacterized phage protein (TIGR01671 family)
MNNRTLKFRAWDTLAKQFTYPDRGYQGHYVLTLNGQFQNLQNGSGGDEYVVQQFTGLKDSKGVEIYEGDIVRGKFFDTEYRHLETINSEVVWIERYACFNIGIEEWRYSGERVTVIGNIFENSELLNNEN